MLNSFAQLITKRTYQVNFDLHLFGLTIPFESIIGVAGILAVPALIYAATAARASKHANELRTVPILMARLEEKDGKGVITLANLTSKFAHHITVMPVFLTHKKEGEIYKTVFDVEGRNYLKGNEEVVLSEKTLKGGSVDASHNFAKIITQIEWDDKNIPLLVLFRDSQNIQYFTKLSFKRGNELIVTPPTRLTRLRKLRILFKQRRRLLKLQWYEFRRFNRSYPSADV